MKLPTLAFALVLVALTPFIGTAHATWDPSNGDWGKTHPDDLRVMTWNWNSRIYPGANTTDGLYAWAATARIVADMQPDVLLLQEGGDGTSQAALLATLEDWMHGGAGIDSYVQKYAPAYDLPYIYVSPNTDSYNRNVILSRYPFADLNGDTWSQRGDIPYILPDEYAPGGTGGIRGFMFTEIDLPDYTYVGDLVAGNAHLKAYGSQSEHNERVAAAKNVAYYIDYLLNGAGTGIPDPHNKIQDSPPATTILDANTPVVIGGDWNEDELYSMSNYGEKGPAGWLTQAAVNGGSDGTDRDRSDSTYDSAVEPYTGNRSTQSSSKLDYIAWQDSIATYRRGFIFNSSALASDPDWFPPAVGSSPYPGAMSGIASDHRPVIVDLILPLANLPEFDLNIITQGQGSVVLDPPGGTYTQYTPVQLLADPDPSWYFIEWQGDLTGWENPTTILMDDDKTVTVVFDTSPAPEYTLTVNIVGDGVVTLDPPSGPYHVGLTVELTADPGNNWYLDRWEGDLTGNASPEYLYMDADKTVTAVFEKLYPCGDANCDGAVNNGDIDAFVLAVQYPALYDATYPGCENADMNGDGLYNNGDIDPFVAALGGVPCD